MFYLWVRQLCLLLFRFITKLPTQPRSLSLDDTDTPASSFLNLLVSILLPYWLRFYSKPLYGGLTGRKALCWFYLLTSFLVTYCILTSLWRFLVTLPMSHGIVRLV